MYPINIKTVEPNRHILFMLTNITQGKIYASFKTYATEKIGFLKFLDFGYLETEKSTKFLFMKRKEKIET